MDRRMCTKYGSYQNNKTLLQSKSLLLVGGSLINKMTGQLVKILQHILIRMIHVK